MAERQVFVKGHSKSGKRRKIGITKSFLRERIFKPKKCSRFRATKTPSGHVLTFCKLKGKNKWALQSIAHPKTRAEARKLGIEDKVYKQ